MVLPTGNEVTEELQVLGLEVVGLELKAPVGAWALAVESARVDSIPQSSCRGELSHRLGVAVSK